MSITKITQNNNVLENSGEHGILASWVVFEVCAREQWRTQSTWRTREQGILVLCMSWICVREHREMWSMQRTGEQGILKTLKFVGEAKLL